MNDTIIQQLTTEIDNAFFPERAVEIGMLTMKIANQTITDAFTR
ncbi:unknown [Alistipes sp. CAG:831]|nr:unknown [Alistipes sp. CAG:831]